MSAQIVDSRNVLVIMTADNCSACGNFKASALQPLKKELQTLGIVRVVEVNKKKMADPVDVSYPIQLDLLGNWYPRFILINGKAWNDKFSESKNSELPVEIFGATYKDGATKID